ncbi:MAG: sensor histidine kinase [Cyanophyceae cyanobacterium]
MFDRSRRRLAYLFTLSMGSILVLFAGTVYHRQAQEQIREFDARIYAQARRIASMTNYRPQEKGWQIDTENVALQDENIMQSQIICLRWYDSQKRLLQFIGRCSHQQTTVTPGWQSLRDNLNQGKPHYQNLRQLTLPLTSEQSFVGYLQVAVSLESLQETLARSRLFLSFGIPITLGLTGSVGWVLGGLAMQPARRSYEQLQRFTADASHELRAPVAAILSNAQVGLLAPADDTQQIRQRLANIVTQSKSMSALIANLLFLARHEGRLNDQDFTKTDLVELLTSLKAEYETLARRKGLKFRVEVSTAALEIYSDRDLLQQALRNLLDNAIKYTPDGGAITLALTVKPRRILVTVEDTGIGIPASDLPHIFERFYRVDTVRSRAGGFGLGLAIAQQIVQAHGGKITVTSGAGGTSFEICLPLRSLSRDR